MIICKNCKNCLYLGSSCGVNYVTCKKEEIFGLSKWFRSGEQIKVPKKCAYKEINVVITLITQHEILTLHNPKIFDVDFDDEIGQYTLTFDDDNYEDEIIYTSTSESSLLETKEIIISKIAKGKKRINIC